MPLRGPENNGGQCPSPTNEINHQCCCGDNCCWGQCELSEPPANCLDGFPSAHWIFNVEKGYYFAFIPGKNLTAA